MATLGGALALNARRHPDKTALIFGESIYSYEQLAARTDQYAHALASLGVGKGDRVALLSPNSDAYVLGLYGAFRLGAIAVPLNPRVPARELRYLLEDSGATVLLYSEELAVVVAGLDELDPLPSAPQSLVLDEAAAQGIARLADTMPTTAPEAEVIEDDDCIILYTSGTTGRPKGALFDHHRMLWVGNSVSALGMNSFDRNLHVAPMYHCAELVLFVMSGFSLGTTHVVLPAFEPKAVLDALEKHRITVFLGVPTMYQMLLQYPELGTRDLSAWRLGFFGAAPMPPNAATSLLATLPHVQFFQLCGQTEGGPTGIFLTPDEVRARPDATGRMSITNAETRIVDDEGNDTAVGEPGEIIYRGETIMKGYWNKPEATMDALRNGWLHSGDVAVRDADGYITIVDRMKDMIITGGRNVYSVEVEQALASHPDVADVAVVGRPDEMFGESIIAVVTPVEGRDVALESLREYGSQYIAGYKLPRELITRPIPRNPSGKILKHVLRDAITEGAVATN
ncbi:class I adenylate-forming enzyme family protein [Dietzia maris]|jgi:fatty-acyl-CoA synthase/feruloyl-CoA synthase|uniref:O-succinylbenzoate--CoA ligase n=1 Tax=Dietzia maris TaxID=37915 RepID=A0A365P751_9ACTN|nr:long-chain fatty acid--CoA ligase [Dietzia maris]MBB0992586.1 long-chain fatty acid--CoA ligase [Dietzia sp. SLG510A3-30A2]MBB0993812.1 long-chain fatty acid--CoA ligase [Dietzia sp. SLG510A3-40A3]MBB1010492.1 long-chain fatty acid--CoA ligase [Dietzia sp. SLG510A3-3B2-2]MBB0998514.1 long-chain fatty acid--CoA ligase [Dietzia maris]RBA31883.1 o-succinylbenzoate--CoA ligase [Dietzia maris]